MESDELKRRFIHHLTKARKAASLKLIERGQEMVRQGHFIKTIADSVEEYTNYIPDDSYYSADEWNRVTDVWVSAANNIDALTPVGGGGFQITAATTMSANAAFMSPRSRIRQLDPQKEQCVNKAIGRIIEVVLSSEWDEELENDLRRLGLDVAIYGRSPLDLLRESQIALVNPSGSDLNPTSVLIPMRECINQVLSGLLRRRPTQEQASHGRDKVNSICSQLAKDGIDSGTIGRLAHEAEQLVNQLSSAKQGTISPEEIRSLFLRGKSFLKALLAVVDEAKMR
jgi:hypothetical protein